MKPIAPLRPSPIAGSWYESDPEKLASELDGYLNDARLPNLNGEVMALIAPHAGYRYSGAVAGHAFAAVRDRHFDAVALLSPMHAPYSEAFLTSAHFAYKTPLGVVPVARELVDAADDLMRAAIGKGLTLVAHDQEHSLEIELPFLQRALRGEFVLLPVMIRSTAAPELAALGQALAEVLRGKNALLVASTDLSHFYPQAVAEVLDAEMLRQIAAFSPDGVLRAELEGRGFACGRGAVAAVLHAARELGANSVEILNYATSAKATGDETSVVGYGAAAILRETF
jgi:AmmeMemoRadiSam system protein B